MAVLWMACAASFHFDTIHTLQASSCDQSTMLLALVLLLSLLTIL
jgi:hypothetical protein